MKLPEKFISCDWGTTNFRLRLIETKSLKILSEHTTDMGIKKRFQEFKEQSSISQDQFFAEYLKNQIKNLDGAISNDYVIVASGMLSSSIGMHELNYANMPLAFNGEDLISKYIPFDDMPDLLLVSGAKTDADVMRGEEVQAIGLSKALSKHEKGILLLPGTHCKHITFEANVFKDFTTYMTGELFDTIGKHTILSASLTSATWDVSFQDIFLKGVKKGLADQQMQSLFSIRANTLINQVSGEQNFYFLSGLMIGGELASLQHKDGTIFLAASGIYSTLYKLALESFLPAERIVCFEEQVLEQALLTGQQQILHTYAE
ncbi:2-keto-3-deoxy-galactonokinase [Zobellia amurskyensis]|uniref:2-keto-3-deoxy-galactonokinase n=1 Tax=Zobellia amurskyensis TaxID=248905 RepID=A0A7X3D1K3_9FLAO|nr:2-dehydro-3-deoxygalactonokinase [Zobellia amurskyensis]MUH36274.1 2-keto-3-deoxy-galactonokinase [Zobellia amurskyensis]